MKKAKVWVVMLVLSLLVGLVGCGKSEGPSAPATGGETAGGSGSEDKVKIAYIVKALTDQFWIDMQTGALETATELGVDLAFQAPEKETNVETQIQYMENAIAGGFDAIILSAADSKALNPTIVKANQAGIPVILVNDTIDLDALAADGGKVETYVGIDQYEAASLAGKYAVETIDGGKVAVLEGAAGVLAGEQRMNGFLDQLTDNFEVVASQTANWDRNQAFNVMQNILTSQPDIKVVWAVSAEMGQGAIQAIEQAGLAGQISVFDFDASADDMEAIKAGTLVGTVAQYPNLQAKAAIEAALAAIEGQTLEAHTKTLAELITIDNIQ
ncbi:sugar ABC transporter substrate-binding protein [Anaerotalea alkaliphila]|uniref:Sugar ABC transporter substrate-binding protein n=1 Tax=Anaerotalea alkaliphila TaxID=2662126 RepID=A0A7X5HXN5_9FIRM|nr:sugar ABC transporter substrate-binding protein [Anaerotalea alkaliphila]NDL68562.1 sugar ABC transporter substrate-binding protein [Anaerotalea alkaliphila]